MRAHDGWFIEVFQTFLMTASPGQYFIIPWPVIDYFLRSFDECFTTVKEAW
jgi:hypothetical protein